MFDVGFSEIIVIAIVALIVIGPERLPTVARTLGHLLGRLQRYVGDVKADIEREMNLDELKKMQAEIQSQANEIERSMVREMQSVEGSLNAEAKSLADVMADTGNAPGASAEPTAASLSDFDPLKDLPPASPPPDAVAVSPDNPGPAAAVAASAAADRQA